MNVISKHHKVDIITSNLQMRTEVQREVVCPRSEPHGIKSIVHQDGADHVGLRS